MLDFYPLINYPLELDTDDYFINYVLRDILTRNVFVLTEEEQEEYFQLITIGVQDRPEDVAYKLYNDEKLHWTILFANEMHDYYSEWYRDQHNLLQYSIEKYGEVGLSALHSLIDSYGNRVGTVYRTQATYTGDSVMDTITVSLTGHGYVTGDKVYIHAKTGDASSETYEIISYTADEFVVEANLVMNVAGICDISPIHVDSMWLFNEATNPVPSYDPTDVRGLTNYEYEVVENELKKTIRVIKPEYISMFTNNFRIKVSDERI